MRFIFLYTVIFLKLLSTMAFADGCPPNKSEQSNKIVEHVYKNRFKPWPQLTKYYNCFKNKKSTFSENDKNAIEMISKHFKIPQSLLFCLFFVESRFDGSSRSPVGAQGIAQLMSSTLKSISFMIKDPGEDAINHCDELESGKKFSEKDKVYCDSLRLRHHDHQSIIKLQKELRKKGLIKNDIKLSTSDRIGSMVAGAFFISRLIDQVSDFYLVDRSQMEKLDIRVLKLSFSGYNGGQGRLATTLSGYGRKNIDGALAAARTEDETRSHMDGIENCMIKGDGDAPSSRERKEGKQCKDVMP